MARLAERLPENAAGQFFVDATCIDCGKCREVAPTVFGLSGRGLSYVHRQPASGPEQKRALMALVACPTASIGAHPPADARAAAAAFPEEIAPGIYDCGFLSASSYGATSYLVQRPDGNVLVDSPRANGPLMDRIAALGGVRFLFLTHRDDVADHASFQARFRCERVMHERDLTPETLGVERVIAGDDPATLDESLLVIPVPGHTAGSAALLDRETYLFTGDHLWASEDGRELEASRSVCWHSWPEQKRSLARLLDFRFAWILPGHGRRFRAISPEAMAGEIRSLLERLG